MYEAIDLAIKIILKRKQKDKQIMKLNKQDMEHLFKLAATNMPFIFNELYLQLKGVSMDSPLAPILPDILMENIEN